MEVPQNDAIEESTGYKEKTQYSSIILSNIREFYDLVSKPCTDELEDRDERIIKVIINMMNTVEIFEDKEVIEKEFVEVKEFLDCRKNIGYDEFIDLMHKIAVACQRIWHKKRLLLTPVPYQEDIYKTVHDQWTRVYPEKFSKEQKTDGQKRDN